MLSSLDILKTGHGGKREGSGARKGSKWTRTLAKEAARELVRTTVTAEMGEMVAAQVQNAKGIQHFVLRTKDGKFEKVTSGNAAVAAMNDPESVYEFWTVAPSVQAFTDLMNRALDKPKEQAQAIDLHVTGDLAAAIAEGRQRAAARNRKA